MKNNYESKFYELMERCFTYIDERNLGKFASARAKEAILWLWVQESLTIEGVTITQELIRKCMLERLSVVKLEDFIKAQRKRGWSFRRTNNAIDLYLSLLTKTEKAEIFDDERNFKVILD